MTGTELHSGNSAGPADTPADGFGAGAVRWWRRLAGAGVVSLLALGFGVLAIDDLDRDGRVWALLVLACTYTGVLVSRFVSGSARGGALVARHAAAGTALGLVLALVLTVAFPGSPELFVLWAVICLPSGALVGAGAAAAALLVPQRAAAVVAVAGVLAAGALAYLAFRPLAPHDLFAVEPTEQVAAAGGAGGLAERTREAVERIGAGGDLRTATTWETVASQVSTGLGDAQAHLRFTPAEDLPTSALTGERVRLITVEVRGQDSACVIVDVDAARVADDACRDLDLTR
ncbi:hypothetical protein [Kineococcus glutinatus]|uniref:Uncharacterized protein n=1 Tax=Kineococcus glutinatus TaxID=1070872 RepID=A0ABP9HNE4_9ACTN